MLSLSNQPALGMSAEESGENSTVDKCWIFIISQRQYLMILLGKKLLMLVKMSLHFHKRHGGKIM